MLRRSPPKIRAQELATVLLVFASVAALSLRHLSPRGWDPSFHCLLVDSLSRGSRPTTWEPWEPVSVHYTLGADALVAHVARATGLAPHEAFEQSFPFAYALVAWSALGAFRRATRSRLAAVPATLALGFAAMEMRLMYHWGGLPTVLGVALALGAAGARSWVTAGLLLGTLPHLHHLSALIAWSVALVLGGAFRSRAVAKALALAVLVALPLVPSVLGALHDAGSTSILRFADEPRRSALEYVWSGHHWGWGPPLLGLAALGAALAQRWRGRAKAALVGFALLAFVHVALDVVYREVARRTTGEDFTALTPSRWFQLASVPLAALAGLAVARVAGRRFAPLGALFVVLVSLPFVAWEYDTKAIDPELFRVGAWARERLPADAFVVVRARSATSRDLSLLPSRSWWPYLLARETDETPLPASEPRNDPRVLAKRALAADPQAARAHARARGKRLFWLGPAAIAPPPGARRAGVYGGVIALDEDAP